MLKIAGIFCLTDNQMIMKPHFYENELSPKTDKSHFPMPERVLTRNNAYTIIRMLWTWGIFCKKKRQNPVAPDSWKKEVKDCV
jgi:hypothetical protein